MGIMARRATMTPVRKVVARKTPVRAVFACASSTSCRPVSSNRRVSSTRPILRACVPRPARDLSRAWSARSADQSRSGAAHCATRRTRDQHQPGHWRKSFDREQPVAECSAAHACRRCDAKRGGAVAGDPRHRTFTGSGYAAPAIRPSRSIFKGRGSAERA